MMEWGRFITTILIVNVVISCIWIVHVQASRHQSLDDVVEYLGGLDSDPARPGERGAAVFKPGWEDIFRMNQKQLEVAVRRMWSDTGAPPPPPPSPFPAAMLHLPSDGGDDNTQLVCSFTPPPPPTPLPCCKTTPHI